MEDLEAGLFPLAAGEVKKGGKPVLTGLSATAALWGEGDPSRCTRNVSQTLESYSPQPGPEQKPGGGLSWSRHTASFTSQSVQFAAPSGGPRRPGTERPQHAGKGGAPLNKRTHPFSVLGSWNSKGGRRLVSRLKAYFSGS